MPQCPVCNAAITELYTNKTVRLSWLNLNGGSWQKTIVDETEEIICPACRTALGQEELDTLKVPNEIR